MDLLYKNNSIKINKKIAELQNDKKRREKRVKICSDIFIPLSTLHIVLAGVYGLSAIVGAIVNKTIIPMYFMSSIAIGIISSCAISLGINGIVKTINENKIEKLNDEINNYNNMLEEYNHKPEKSNFKDMTKNMRSKNISRRETRTYNEEYQNLYENTQEDGIKLSLRR